MSQGAEAMLSRYLGCLLGLAIGDALGAPAEFLTLEQIKRRYGEQGIAESLPRCVKRLGVSTILVNRKVLEHE